MAGDRLAVALNGQRNDPVPAELGVNLGEIVTFAAWRQGHVCVMAEIASSFPTRPQPAPDARIQRSAAVVIDEAGYPEDEQGLTGEQQTSATTVR